MSSIRADYDVTVRKPSLRSFLFARPLPLERECGLFVLASALDVLMTYLLLLRDDFTESNPIALFFLMNWGIKGMIAFKFFMVAVVAAIAQYIALTHLKLARRVLNFGTLVVAGVVIYSFTLYVREADVIAALTNLNAI
jgi:hypothetical protein